MYRFAALLLVVALANSNAVAAIVEFNPSSQDADWLGRATFEVTVIPEVEGGFDTADIVFGSDDGLTMVDFTYSDDWEAAFTTVLHPVPVGVYPWDDLLISGGSPTLNDVPSLFAGTLTVDVAGLTWGAHYVHVDAGIDGFSCLGQRGVPDLAYGGAVVYYPPIPEPGTLSLLALASLAMLRRRARRT